MNQEEDHKIRKHLCEFDVGVSVIHFFKNFVVGIHREMKAVDLYFFVENV